MITDCHGIPYPSKEEIESGKFDGLGENNEEPCVQVWRDRFLLTLDEDGNVEATPRLKELWKEEDTK